MPFWTFVSLFIGCSAGLEAFDFCLQCPQILFFLSVAFVHELNSFHHPGHNLNWVRTESKFRIRSTLFLITEFALPFDFVLVDSFPPKRSQYVYVRRLNYLS